MKTINIETINFQTVKEASLNENYPNSGLFIVRIKEGTNDLRFVNKKEDFNFFITPEPIFDDVFQVFETLEKEKYEGDFILEFAKILLNRK